MKPVLFSLLALALVCAAPVQADPTAAERDANYQTLLAQAKSGGAVDWQALRFAYADRDAYEAFGTDDARRAAMKILSDKDWPALKVAAEKLIADNYVDARAHRFLAYAYQGLQRDKAEIDKEYDISDAILKSIESGDGLTPETPFVVIAVYEEYDLMLFRRWHLEKQALRQVGGHVYDVMDVTTRDGKKVTYYFQIDRAWAAEAKLLTPK